MERDYSGENNQGFVAPDDEEQLRIAEDGGGVGRDNSEHREPLHKEAPARASSSEKSEDKSGKGSSAKK